MLKYPQHWRIDPPSDGEWLTERVPQEACDEFVRCIYRVAKHRTEIETEKDTIEKYKQAFSESIGTDYFPSSSLSWARSDLGYLIEEAASNPPLFIEAFWDGSQVLRSTDQRRVEDTFYIPDADLVNRICEKHKMGYRLDPPSLELKNETQGLIAPEEEHVSLERKARKIVFESLGRAEELLLKDRRREAVQESLWLLESISTVFEGQEIGDKQIEGKYFNEILEELYHSQRDRIFSQAIKWVQGIHGYLSSPTGGGVRHGTDLKESIELNPTEARLLVNLIRSYALFFLAEHQRLVARLKE